MAELLLVNDVAPQNQASEVSHQWSAFKLQPASKNLKLKTKKYIVVSEVEFEESILTEVNKQLLKRPKISLTQNFLDIKFFEPKFFLSKLLFGSKNVSGTLSSAESKSYPI